MDRSNRQQKERAPQYNAIDSRRVRRQFNRQTEDEVKEAKSARKKKWWLVSVTVDALASVYVQAETEAEARELGFEQVEPSEAELADVMDVVDCCEVSEEFAKEQMQRKARGGYR